MPVLRHLSIIFTCQNQPRLAIMSLPLLDQVGKTNSSCLMFLAHISSFINIFASFSLGIYYAFPTTDY